MLSNESDIQWYGEQPKPSDITVLLKHLKIAKIRLIFIIDANLVIVITYCNTVWYVTLLYSSIERHHCVILYDRW